VTTGDADPHAGAADEDQAVLRYLEALETARTASDSFPDPEGAGPAMAGAAMVAPDDKKELEVELAESTPGSQANVAALEGDFVKAAAAYGRRHDITYQGWRQAGVAAEVLARAGIEAPAE
jgi:hypothetical protein